jgi:hypothetical protein
MAPRHRSISRMYAASVIPGLCNLASPEVSDVGGDLASAFERAPVQKASDAGCKAAASKYLKAGARAACP